MEDDNGVKKITGMNCTYVSKRNDKRFEVIPPKIINYIPQSNLLLYEIIFVVNPV